jgi:hypothetical protein
LENTLGKIIDSVIMELISYVVEKHQLIPQHFGGWPGRAGEDAMAVLVEKSKEAWKGKEIYSASIHGHRGCLQQHPP